MAILEEIEAMRPLNWSDRLMLHIRYLGHLPIHPRPYAARMVKGRMRIAWRVECAICGKVYEDVT